MMNYFMISLIFLIAAMLISRVITIRAMNKLDNDQKAQLLDISRQMSRYQILALIILIVVLYVTMRYLKEYGFIIIAAYFVLMVVYLQGRAIYVYSRLKKMGFPRSYLNSHLISSAIQTLGILLFGVLVVMQGGIIAKQ